MLREAGGSVSGRGRGGPDRGPGRPAQRAMADARTAATRQAAAGRGARPALALKRRLSVNLAGPATAFPPRRPVAGWTDEGPDAADSRGKRVRRRRLDPGSSGPDPAGADQGGCTRGVQRRARQQETTMSVPIRSVPAASGALAHSPLRRSTRAGDGARTSAVFDPASGAQTGELPLVFAGRGGCRRADRRERSFPPGRPRRRHGAAKVLFKLRELLEARADTPGPRHQRRTRQDPQRRPGRGAARHRGGGVRLRHPAAAEGRAQRERGLDDDSHGIRQPLGVVAGITPFNFPAMVPLWMFPSPWPAATPSC